MRVGVPKEIKLQEYRVGLTPSSVREYAARGHEVLGCVAGHARIGFGSDAGMVAEIEVGDVAVIPAGVGHRRSSRHSPGTRSIRSSSAGRSILTPL